MVTDSSAAAAMAKVLVKTSGRKEAALLAGIDKDRKETDGDYQEREEETGSDLDGRFGNDLRTRPGFVAGLRRAQASRMNALLFAVQMLVSVLDHDNSAVDHDSNSDGDTPQAHDVCADAEEVHEQQAGQHARGHDEDRHQLATGVEQEEYAD
jgi:hypothetical protein